MRVKSLAQQLQIQLQLYEANFPKIPVPSELSILATEQPGWNPMREEDTLDPWKRPYFMCEDQKNKRQICSYGEDGQAGGTEKNQDFYLSDEKSWPAWLKDSVN